MHNSNNDQAVPSDESHAGDHLGHVQSHDLSFPHSPEKADSVNQPAMIESKQSMREMSIDRNDGASSNLNPGTARPSAMLSDVNLSTVSESLLADVTTGSHISLSKHAAESSSIKPASHESPSSLMPTQTIWQYIRSELLSDDFEESQDLKTERIRNFLIVPFEMEQFLHFGYLICLDSFLHIFTILPLRILIALWGFMTWFFFGGVSMKPAQKTDLIKGALVCICTYYLQFFDASRLYHSVRGQALIKLYVIFNVLEICDKLCSAFGHDILDSLFSTSYASRLATSGARRLSRVTHFVVATMYIFSHALVLFYQVMTLNVAVNSYNNALMTLLLSNQFVEIKSSVFKRFEKENLFQLSCSDIVERFQLSVFLVIICIRNCIEVVGGRFDWFVFDSTGLITDLQAFATSAVDKLTDMPDMIHQLSSRPIDIQEILEFIVYAASSISTKISSIFASEEYRMIELLLAPVLIVYATEILVDWLKHAFITKFNGIAPNIYSKFYDSLCRDLSGSLKSRQSKVSDESNSAPPEIVSV
eukprot:jgi/Hompol1/5030/HPOL_000565-RA